MKKYITLRNFVMFAVISRDLYWASTNPGSLDLINGCIAAFVFVALYPKYFKVKLD